MKIQKAIITCVKHSYRMVAHKKRKKNLGCATGNQGPIGTPSVTSCTFFTTDD